MNYDQLLREIEEDFAVSHWLKRACRALDGRDPVDSLYDARALVAIQEARLKELGVTQPITAAAAFADSEDNVKRMRA